MRERPEDIRWLAERMLKQIAADQGGALAAVLLGISRKTLWEKMKRLGISA